MSEVTVNCFTRSRSAKPGRDYTERPKLRNSTILFGKSIERAICRINLIDDNDYEEEEFFLVKLAHPESEDDIRVILGKHKLVRVRITNNEDKPKVNLEQSTFTIGAPESERNNSKLVVSLERRGDLGRESRVRLITRDASAIGGSDYVTFDDVITFGPDQNR